MEKCQYCQEDGKHQEKCPDKLPAGPERDHAMADWGAGALLASMGEDANSSYKDLHPYFALGYNTRLKMDEDVQRGLKDDGMDIDDDMDTIRRR